MQFRPFKELFEIPLRNGLTKPKAVRGVGTKMVNMGELFANPRIINISMDRVPLSVAERNSSLLVTGDLLFARQSLVLAGAGKCSIFVDDEEDVCFESHIIRCRLNNDLANPHYYFYFFGSSVGRKLLESIVEQGAGASGIRGSDLAELQVPWIDPQVQRAVVKILQSLDDKIDLNRRINQTLEAMVQTIFKSWFVNFDPVKAKIAAIQGGRDPLSAAMSAISGKSDAELNDQLGKQYDELAAIAELFPSAMDGEIPQGWNYKTLAELTYKIGSGATPRGGKEVYCEAGVALIRSQNVYDSLFVWEGLARISDEAAAQLKGVTVQEEDVLLNITGASILRTCVVEPDVLPARVNQHVSIIRTKLDIPPRFVHMYLLQPEVKSYLIGLNAGASREAITKGHIESLTLLTPNTELLVAFRAMTDSLFQQIQVQTRQMRVLGELRDTLIPKLLSGELNINMTTESEEGV